MRRSVKPSPDRLPDCIRHWDDDTAIPTWRRITEAHPTDAERISKIIARTPEPSSAEDVWNSWSGSVRRSVALLLDKITHEGWLDAIDGIEGWPWDGGFFFHTSGNALADFLSADAGYCEGKLGRGLFAYLSGSSHRGWTRSWMENDTANASLHVGVFENGIAEVHLDAFNPLFVNGARREDIVRIPMIGSYNHRLFLLHQRWEK